MAIVLNVAGSSVNGFPNLGMVVDPLVAAPVVPIIQLVVHLPVVMVAHPQLPAVAAMVAPLSMLNPPAPHAPVIKDLPVMPVHPVPTETMAKMEKRVMMANLAKMLNYCLHNPKAKPPSHAHLAHQVPLAPWVLVVPLAPREAPASPHVMEYPVNPACKDKLALKADLAVKDPEVHPDKTVVKSPFPDHKVLLVPLAKRENPDQRVNPDQLATHTMDLPVFPVMLDNLVVKVVLAQLDLPAPPEMLEKRVS